MATPFEQSYESRDQLLTTLRNYAFSQGYVIVTNNSNPERNVTLRCDRGGHYVDKIKTPDGAKRRRTKTRLVGCNFHLYASLRTKGDNRWHVKVVNGEHTHELEADLTAHPGARTLTPQQRKDVFNHMNEGLPPRHIIKLVKERHPDIRIIPQDIYNLKKAFRCEQEAGHTAMESLQLAAPEELPASDGMPVSEESRTLDKLKMPEASRILEEFAADEIPTSPGPPTAKGLPMSKTNTVVDLTPSDHGGSVGVGGSTSSAQGLRPDGQPKRKKAAPRCTNCWNYGHTRVICRPDPF